MTANRLSCEDKNECEWQSCGHGGICSNFENGRGWSCDCPIEGFRCDNCSCDDGPFLRPTSASVGLGGDALAVIILSLLFYLSKSLQQEFTLIFYLNFYFNILI